MLSFRVDDAEAQSLQDWATKTGLDRSELLRIALHKHLRHLTSIEDAKLWEDMPLSEEEQSLTEINDWGIAEDWSDWK
jgi:hypothetical protein